MKKYKRIIVALDNTDFDNKLISYFDKFCDLSVPEKIHFVYVDKNLEIPASMEISYKDETGNPIPKDELLKKIIGQKVREHFGERHGAEVEIDVLEGSPLKELLHWVKVKSADLLVMGNKKYSDGSGVVAKRIARNTECAVLFVPETSRSKVHKILVPIDFSEHSKVAMENAITLAHELGNATITCFNVFDAPLTGYPTINMSYEKFVRNMSSFKEEAFTKYVNGFDLKGVEVATAHTINELNSAAKHINEFAQKNDFDLIVMGAKGHHAIERVLLGSVTEKLLGLDKEIPVLVLRK